MVQKKAARVDSARAVEFLVGVYIEGLKIVDGLRHNWKPGTRQSALLGLFPRWKICRSTGCPYGATVSYRQGI